MRRLIVLLAVLICISAYATGTLIDIQVYGQYKYCKYSNGVVIKVQAWQSCPSYIR